MPCVSSDDQVKVVGHEAVDRNPASALGNDTMQDTDEAFNDLRILENSFPVFDTRCEVHRDRAVVGSNG